MQDGDRVGLRIYNAHLPNHGGRVIFDLEIRNSFSADLPSLPGVCCRSFVHCFFQARAAESPEAKRIVRVCQIFAFCFVILRRFLPRPESTASTVAARFQAHTAHAE